MRMLMRQMLVHARKHEIWLVSANAEGCAQTQAKQDLDRLQQAYRCLHPTPYTLHPKRPVAGLQLLPLCS